MPHLDWSFTAALITTGVAVLLPWMLMVHSRLAVVLSKLSDLEKRLAHLAAQVEALCHLEHQRQLDAARWESRLRAMEEQLVSEQ